MCIRDRAKSTKTSPVTEPAPSATAKTYLVTGGAGFLGINLTRYLLGRGHKVVSLDIADFTYPERDRLPAVPETLVARLNDDDPDGTRDLHSVQVAREGLLACMVVEQDTLAEHRAIVAALEARNPAAAREATRSHLGQLIRHLEPLERDRPDLFESKP